MINILTSVRRVMLLAFMCLPVRGAPFTPEQTQVAISLAPGFEPVPHEVTLTPGGAGFNFAGVAAVSDRTWLQPSVDTATGRLRMGFVGSASLIVSTTATVTLTHGTDVRTVFVQVALAPLNVVTLLDDPRHSRTYGLHQPSGSNPGCVVALEPITGQSLGSAPVGRRPTDMALSRDGSELLVLNAVDETLTVLNALTLAHKETIALPEYDNWGVTETTGDLVAGPGSLIYYTDGAWAPALRVFNRTTRTVLQTLQIDAGGYGFGDLALSHDGTKLYGWAQYGWSAGSAGSFVASFAADAAGRLTALEKSTNSYPNPPLRDPLTTPVLLSADSTSIFIKTQRFAHTSIVPAAGVFPTDIYAITPGGEVAATTGALYETATGLKLSDGLELGAVQAITSDYARLVYFHNASREIRRLNLPETIGLAVMGRTLVPADGAVVLPPARLEWSPLAGTDIYRIYLGTSHAAVLAATPASPEYHGEAMGHSFALSPPPAAGTTYYWRVDAVTAGVPAAGGVYRFVVSQISTDSPLITAATVQGHDDFRTSVTLGAATTLPWTASADQPWVRLPTASGSAPGSMTVSLDASNLAAGQHQATVTLTGASGLLLTLPVSLRVDPLRITHLRSDRSGPLVYAISEENANLAGRAYLLEIDSASERILRSVPVGWSVTDLAIHYAENRLYVPNWSSGSLRALNRTTLQPERSYAFKPFGGVGYGDGDVFRIAAGTEGRIAVEEMDQWIDIDLINTVSGQVLKSAFVREGGGAFDPTGRFYYHGENNSSGASIQKFDMLGDAFLQLAEVRPANMPYYYGSRTVVVSESGNAVFWAGVQFNAALLEQWTPGTEIFSTTPDGRLAFAESKVFDTVLRREVLAMPVASRVSAYNGTTSKLIVPIPSGLGFYPLTTPLTLPAPVLTAEPQSARLIRLTWTDRSMELGFELQWRAAGVAEWTDHTSALAANLSTFDLGGLTPSATYQFRVRAVAGTLSSDWSAVAAATTMAAPPDAPALSVLAVHSDRIEFSITGAGADQFEVERATDYFGDGWAPVATLPGTATSYADTAVTPGINHHYRVKAVKGTLSSDWVTLYYLVPPVPVPPPPAPYFLLAAGTSSTRAAVYWSAVPDAHGYIIERMRAPGAWLEAGRTDANTTYFNDFELRSGTYYIYRLRAYNDGGISAPSLTAMTFTPSQWDEWRVLHFGTPAATGAAASMATGPDGLTNLARFAFNLPASGPAPVLQPGATSGLPRIWLDRATTRLQVEFVRRRADLNPGLNYIVQFGDSTAGLTAGGRQVTVEPLSDGWERVHWEDHYGPQTKPIRFARVCVIEAP